MRLHYSLAVAPYRRARSGTDDGWDDIGINPRGYIPAPELEDGTMLREGPAIVQFLAVKAPQAELAPPGTMERVRLAEGR